MYMENIKLYLHTILLVCAHTLDMHVIGLCQDHVITRCKQLIKVRIINILLLN